MKKLKLLIHIIFFSKKFFKKPKKVQILLFDNIHQEIFENFFKNRSFDGFDIRFNEINLIILIKAIFHKGFRNILYNYSVQYIKAVDPEIVINFLDTRIDFYKLKKNFKKIKFISIQFAYRANKYPDIFQTLSQKKIGNLKCDHLFCFSKYVGKEYSKFIDTNIISLGSFRNNNYFPKFKKQSYKLKRRICFISQFRRQNSDRGLEQINKIDREEFYLPEKISLPIIQKLSVENNYEFGIIGCSKNNDNLEIDFFKGILKNNNFNFLKLKNDDDSYNNCYESEILVFIDSTLGYESISSGKKAISINSRKPYFDVNTGFGWPYLNDLKGDYWTNEHTLSEIKRIFSYIIKVSKNEWDTEVKKFRENILNFDENNSQLLKILKPK